MPITTYNNDDQAPEFKGSDYIPTYGEAVKDSFLNAKNEGWGATKVLFNNLQNRDPSSMYKPDGQNELTKEQIQNKIDGAGLNDIVKINDAPKTSDALDSLLEYKQNELKYQSALAKVNTGVLGKAGLMGASFAGGLLDPLNLAYVFMPEIGIAEGLGGLVGKVATGAVTGGAGSLLTSPVEAERQSEVGNDYTANDLISNVAYGTAFGGGLHMLTAGIKKAINPYADRLKEENQPKPVEPTTQTPPTDQPAPVVDTTQAAQNISSVPDADHIRIPKLGEDENGHVPTTDIKPVSQLFSKLDDSEKAFYIDKDSNLNENGAQRVRSAVVSSAFNEDMTQLTDSNDPMLNTISNSLYRLSKQIKTTSPEFVQSLANDIKDIAQNKVLPDSNAQKLLTSFENKTPRQITDTLDHYIKTKNIDDLESYAPSRVTKEVPTAETQAMHNLLTGKTNALEPAWRTIDKLDPTVRNAAFRSALGQFVNDSRPDVSPLLKAERGVDFNELRDTSNRSRDISSNIGFDDKLVNDAPELEHYSSDEAELDTHLENAQKELNSLFKNENLKPEDVKFSSATKVLGSDTIQNLNRAIKESYKEGATLLSGKALNIVQKIEDLPQVEGLTYPKNVKAIAIKNRAYIVADNVTVPEVKGLVLHELAGHTNVMQVVMGKIGLNKLYDKIDKEISKGTFAYTTARQLAIDAGTPKELLKEETMSYLLEHFGNTLNSDFGVLKKIKSWFLSAFPQLNHILNVDDLDILLMARKSIGFFSRNELKGESIFKASDFSNIMNELKVYDNIENSHKEIMDLLKQTKNLINFKDDFINFLQDHDWELKSADDLYNMFTHKQYNNNMDEALENYSTILMRQLKTEKLKAYTDAKAKITNINYVANNFINDPVEGLKAIFFGSTMLRANARNSTDAMAHLYEMQYIGLIEKNLLPEDKKIFKDGSLNLDIMKAQDALDNEHPTDSFSPQAVRIAKAINDTQEKLRQRLNQAGKFIPKFKGYIFNQSYLHDMLRLQKTTYGDWLKDAMAHFDLNKMADNLYTTKDKLINDMLPTIFDRLRSGVFYHDFDGELNESSLLTNKYTPSKKVAKSKQRVILFKDAEGFYNYFNKYSNDNYASAVYRTVSRQASQLAIIKTLGISYENNLKNVGKALGEVIQDPRISNKLSDYIRDGSSLDQQLMVLDKRADIPLNHVTAKIFKNIRAWEGMARLAGVVLSSVPDIMHLRFASASDKSNVFNVIKDFSADTIKGLTKKNSTAIHELKNTGYFIDSVMRDTATRYDTNLATGKLKKMQDIFYKVIGLHWWDNNIMTSALSMYMREMGNMAGKDFGALANITKNELMRYGIGADEWDVIRSVNKKYEDGYNYLSPYNLDNAKDILRNQLANDNYKGKALDFATDKKLEDLKDKFNNFYYDRISTRIIPRVEARTKSMLTFGTRAGSLSGEAVRSVTQFKSFMVGYMRNILGNEIYGKGFATISDYLQYGNMGRMLKLVAGLTIMGYLSSSLKNLVSGQMPPSPNWKTLQESMARGGGLGLMGDLLFSEYSTYGKTPERGVEGATLSNVSDLLKIFSEIRNGDKVKGDAFNFLLNNTPYYNLFYTKMILNYLVIYQIQQYLNPDFLNRLKLNAQQNNQNFWMEP